MYTEMLMCCPNSFMIMSVKRTSPSLILVKCPWTFVYWTAKKTFDVMNYFPVDHPYSQPW